jgi:hypothetical protein
MKTSVLISSITAFCLLVTFAVTPRRHGEDKINLASTTDFSFAVEKRATMLPGVVITADKKRESGVTVPVIPAEDLSYLKFDVTDYMESEGVNPTESEVLPEATEADLRYLKFRIDDYSTGSELTGDEIAELPFNEFGYLRFDVNQFINNSGTENTGIGELPEAETGTGQAEVTVPVKTTIELSYLKFDINKYYNPGNQGTEEKFELPEE